jgi:hypothetical protein
MITEIRPTLGDRTVDIKISDRKDPYGDTEVRLVNHAEVITRLREEFANAVHERAAAEGRSPTTKELEEVEATVRSVPTEITIPMKVLRRRGAIDEDEMILSGFFPVRRPAVARIVQAHMCKDEGSDLSSMIKEVVRIRRAAGVDDTAIRTQVLSSIAGNLNELDADARERTTKAAARAIDEALAEPNGIPPESRAKSVKDERRMVAEIVKAARKEGLTETALREHLDTHLAGMRTSMEKMAASGMSASIIEESLRAYRQAIAEILESDNPAIS